MRRGATELTLHLSVPGYSHLNERIYRPGRRAGRTRRRIQGDDGCRQHPSWYAPSIILDVLLHLNSHSLGLRNADTAIIFVSLQGPGLPPPDPSAVSRSAEPHVHVGFLLAYNSVAQTVLDELKPQLQAFPSYNIVVCGTVQLPLLSS